MMTLRPGIHPPLAAVLALLAVLLPGGTIGAVESTDAADFNPGPVTAAPGETVDAQVTIVVHKDFRLIADPAPNKFSAPLMVAFEAAKDLHPLTAVLPASKIFKEEQDFSYSAYDGTIVVKVPIKVDAGATPGDYTLHGHIRYQPLIIDDAGLSGFLKTAVKQVDMKVHVAAKKAK